MKDLESFLGKYIKRNGGDPVYVLASYTYIDISDLGKRSSLLVVLKKVDNKLVEDYLAVSEIRSSNNKPCIIGRYLMSFIRTAFVEVLPAEPRYQDFLLEPVSVFLEKTRQTLVRTVKRDRGIIYVDFTL